MKSGFIKALPLLVLAATAIAEPSPSNYDILAQLNDAPGNVTATANGRIIMSLHQFYQPRYSVVELTSDATLAPFPNEALNDRTDAKGLKLDSVLGIRSDGHGIVWMLDNGMRSGVTPKLVGWDTDNHKLRRLIYLPSPIAPKGAFVNDFAIDNERNLAYISDPANGGDAALIVANLDTGLARRVLEGHASVIPEAIDLIIDQRPVQTQTPTGALVKPHIGVNPITLDFRNEWVYFGPMHGRSLYRIRAADLADEGLDPETLARRVERYSDKPISD